VIEIRRLQKLIRDLHGVDSSHLRSERVVLTYQDETVWEGVVEIFGLKGHPKAGLGYAWSQETDGGGRRYVAILGMPPITSAADAVQVFLASEQP
jgi:hypothetical protein